MASADHPHDHEHEHLDPAVQALLAETLDVARATAEARTERLTDPAADLEPFALLRVASEEDERLVLLGDVAQHLTDAAGTNRVANTLLERYRPDVFAIVSQALASPDGTPEHPQAREVVRVILGAADGTSGSTWCELRRGPSGPRISGLWETAG